MVWSHSSPGTITPGPDVETSPLDERSFRAFTLPNHLRVLVVSDSSSDKAAASLNVSVGTFSDPNELPGLAHFLEHMLFLGTDKYPDEESYNAFLAENGGSSNAYTAPENTNFHFDMVVSDRSPDHPAPRFWEALDRFAQFFTSPLFTEAATDRELNAVHSEHQKNLQSDVMRIHQVKKTSANPHHPYSKFATGSKETLDSIPRSNGIDTRAQLLAFHSKYYSANLMNLCVIAPYPADLLQEWVVQLFSAIPNYKREDPCEQYRQISPISDDKCGLIYHIEPVCDIRLLELTWHLPTYIHDYDSKPASVIVGLLGDEGEGSILKLLKKRGWCDSLGVHSDDMMTFSILGMHISLTDEGINFVDDIISTIYQYIRMLKQTGIPKWVFDEEARLSDIAFRFMERDEPRSFAQHIAASMAQTKPEHYLSGRFLLTKYAPNLIDQALHALTVENVHIAIATKSVEGSTDRKEPWYDAMYRVEEIDDNRVKQWTACEVHKDLVLPPKNLFIPTEFDILGEPLLDGVKDMEGPAIIERNDHFELFHKLDRTFQRPNAKIFIKLWTPWVYTSPRHAAMANLMTTLWEDSLREISYPAEKAGFVYKVQKMASGLMLAVEGYSHRIDVLLNTIVQKMKAFEVDEKNFAMQKDLILRNYVNFDKSQPLARAMYGISYLLEQPRWHVSEYVECFQREEVTYEDMKQFANETLSRMWATSLVCGNISEQQAKKMMKDVQETLGYAPLKKSEILVQRIVELPVGQEVFFRMEHPNNDDNNSAIEVFFQIGALGNFEKDIKLDLLSDILNKPAFHELRTQQQLGYMVFEGVGDTEGVRGLYFLIQSTVADPDVLLERIDEFLINTRKNLLEEMTEEKFQDYVAALAANKAVPDRTLLHRAFRFWSEINLRFLQFDRQEREIEALRRLTKDDVIEMFDDYIAVGGKFRRKLVSQVYGNQHPYGKRKCLQEGSCEVKDVPSYRWTRPLYPVVGRPIEM